MLGEMDGRDSDRLNEIFCLMKKANMNPKKTNKIIPYIRSHYVWAAAVLGAYAKAGSYDKFSRDKEIIKESYVAMREAFGICRAEGIDPAKIMPTSLYYLPLFILVPFTKKLFSNEDMKRMFEGHISGSPDEMKSIYYDVLTEGEKYRIDMPVYKSFKSFLDGYLDRNTLA
jgi:ketopantoate reductase